MDALVLTGLLLYGTISYSEADLFKQAVDENLPCLSQTEEFTQLLRKKTQKDRQVYFVQQRYFGYWSCWSGSTTKQFHQLGEEVGFFKSRLPMDRRN